MRFHWQTVKNTSSGLKLWVLDRTWEQKSSSSVDQNRDWRHALLQSTVGWGQTQGEVGHLKHIWPSLFLLCQFSFIHIHFNIQPNVLNYCFFFCPLCLTGMLLTGCPLRAWPTCCWPNCTPEAHIGCFSASLNLWLTSVTVWGKAENTLFSGFCKAVEKTVKATLLLPWLWLKSAVQVSLWHAVKSGTAWYQSLSIALTRVTGIMMQYVRVKLVILRSYSVDE